MTHPRSQIPCLLLLILPAGLAGQPGPLALPEVIVTADPRPAQSSGLTTDAFGPDKLARSPALAVDDTLRQSAAFSLFRRSGSTTANPTAQGVSMRGLGPSGASRSLVLLDGVPLNDPFGGWVAWSKLPQLTLARAEITRGGGSTLWGSAALGGTVQLHTAPPPVRATVALTGGTRDTGIARAALNQPLTTANTLTLEAAAATTDGDILIRNPGLIDRPHDSRSHAIHATDRHQLSDTTALAVSLRHFDEDRGNGTPLQRNASRETALAASLEGRPGGDSLIESWDLTAYAQDQEFSAFFSAVDPTRATETPANHQYAVPATAGGIALTLALGPTEARTLAGLDLRAVTGESREAFFWNGATFTRDRRAGGEQTFAGAFVRHEHTLAPGLDAHAGLRADHWRLTDGFRRERDTTTNVITRDDRQPDRDGSEFSPSAGLAWQVAEKFRLRAAAWQAFRVPTLNELHRPFRVGAVTTEANPDLAPEHVTGFETGLDLGDARAGLRLTVFENRMRDAVANVTLAPNSRRRENLGEVRVRGLELGAHWQVAQTLRLTADYLLADTRVTDPGAVAPATLRGNRLAQVPRHTVTAGFAWDAPADTLVDLRARWTGAQYEDDENRLRLAPATTVDLRLARRWGNDQRWSTALAVENLLDAEVETGRTAAGLVAITPGRSIRLSVGRNW
ncbi:MAG: TonB-dependent receptor [Verrucomicrobiota bacterium]